MGILSGFFAFCDLTKVMRHLEATHTPIIINWAVDYLHFFPPKYLGRERNLLLVQLPDFDPTYMKYVGGTSHVFHHGDV